jgi:hypothetical protein
MRCGIYPESKRGHLTEPQFGHEVLFHLFIYSSWPHCGVALLGSLWNPPYWARLWRGPTGLTLESALLG